MKVIVVLLSLFYTHALTGQVPLSVDKTEIAIGDQLIATIKTDFGQSAEWINQEAVWPDTLKSIEVISGPAFNEAAGSSTASWTIAIFDTGWVRIPRLPILVRRQGIIDTLFTNDIPIKVLPVEPDSMGLIANKDNYHEPFKPGYYLKYWPHAIGFVLVLLVLYLFIRKQKHKQVEPEHIQRPPLPHEWAENALLELAERKLWQCGEVKEHYTLLTAILREYLERRFGIHAMEQTSDEILTQLQFKQLSEILLQDTHDLLQVADLIKFAKADPGIDIHVAAIERVRAFVQQTIPAYQQQSSDHLQIPDDEIVE